ncbi:MAG: metallophosphoesterase family protein, partial [bacterium]
MVEKIAHISDVHIRKSPARNNEYYEVFEKLYKSLKEKNPSRIVITGDIVNDYIDIQSEQLILLANFLNSLASIAKVIIIRGNHDIQKKNLNRPDTIEA